MCNYSNYLICICIFVTDFGPVWNPRLAAIQRTSDKYTSQRGVNYNNLINIKAETKLPIGKCINSREKPNTANVKNRRTQERLSDAQRSKLKIAHLNIRSLKK